MRGRVGLALLVLTATALLVGCGGGGDSSSVTAGGASSAGEGSGSVGEEPTAAERAKPKPSSEGRAAERAKFELEQYGPPSARSRSFRRSARKGILKHLPEYGDEASGGERAEAQTILRAYEAAVEAGDLKRACESLSSLYVATLKKLSPPGQAPAKTCEQALERALAARPTGGIEFREGIDATVASFRVSAYPQGASREAGAEKAGFALIHGSDGHDWWISMTREEGEWKLTLAVPHLLD